MSAEEVRDARPPRFWIDDAVIDDYGKELGVHGLAVYALLCRRAGKNGESHPSIRRIAEDLGISERQAKRELKKLKDLQLIAIGTRRDERGRQLASIYTVLNVPKKPGDSESLREPGDSETPGGEGCVSHPSVGKDYTEKKEFTPTGEGKPSSLGVKRLQETMVSDLYERLRDRGLLDNRPLTKSYKDQLAGELRTWLKKRSVGEVWRALDFIVYRWPDIALGLTQAFNSLDSDGRRSKASIADQPRIRSREL